MIGPQPPRYSVVLRRLRPLQRGNGQHVPQADDQGRYARRCGRPVDRPATRREREAVLPRLKWPTTASLFSTSRAPSAARLTTSGATQMAMVTASAVAITSPPRAT